MAALAVLWRPWVASAAPELAGVRIVTEPALIALKARAWLDLTARKGADLMVINEVGGQRGFGNVDTAITMIDAAGTVHGSGEGSKPEMASLLFDTILNLQESM